MKENILKIQKRCNSSMHRSVDILLSTYNGSQYLEAQITSLLNQTHENWKLVVRDDGSTDSTVSLIQKYSREYPDEIIFYTDEDKRLGPSQSFSKLMKYSTSDYIMFCDQDDVWAHNKIELTLNKICLLELLYEGEPILVHTDLQVTNHDLRVISDSFWSYQHIDPNRSDLNSLLIQNVVTGCTTMIYKALKDLSFPVPEDAVMHDWWLALTASAYGRIGFICESTIAYRQHGANDTGAKEYSVSYFLSRFNKLKESRMSNHRIYKQCQAFLAREQDRLLPKQYEIIYNFSTLFRMNRFKRIYYLLKYKYRKYGWMRNLAFICVCFLTRSDK